LSANDVFIGIDPTAGKRPFRLAALNDDLRVIAVEATDAAGTLEFIERWPAPIVAVDAPQSLNRGLMRRREVRQQFGLRPGGRTFSDWKVCEYELRRRNLRIYNTPSRLAKAPAWMRAGFDLYRDLVASGFAFYRAGDSIDRRMMIEVHPHACYGVLLGRRPLNKATLEGRLQRQMVLYVEGLDVANPIHVLEEVSRHHLLSGEIPLEGLYGHDELDAMVAAYTAFLIHQRPGRTSQVGDPVEGLITLPSASLKDSYP
jgi:predicted nuclease with RNAse H fold